VLKEPVGGWGLCLGGISLGYLKCSNTRALLLPLLSSAGKKPAGYSAYSWLSAEGNGRGYGEITSIVSSQRSRSKYAITAPRHDAHVSATKAGRRQLPWSRARLGMDPQPGPGEPGTAPRSARCPQHPQQGRQRAGRFWGRAGGSQPCDRQYSRFPACSRSQALG